MTSVNIGSSNGDSAVSVYWNPKALTPGETREYVTHYGLSELQQDLRPPLAVSLTGASSIEVNNSGYIPNPFTITAYIMNSGNAAAENVKATLELPEGLSLVPDQQSTVNLGRIYPNAAEKQISWQVRIEPSNIERNLNYVLRVTADNTTAKTLTRPLCIPPYIAGDDFGDDFDTAGQITTTGTKGKMNTDGDIDCFKFVPSESAVYVIESTGITDLAGNLYNDGKLLFYYSNDISATDKNFKMYVKLTGYKTYYLKTQCFNSSETGFYGIKISKWTPPSPAPASTKEINPVLIPLPQNFTVLNGSLDGEINEPNGEKWYKTTVTNKTGTITVEMILGDLPDGSDKTGKDLDLELYVAEGQKLRLLDYAISFPTQPAYFDEFVYYNLARAFSQGDISKDFYIRVMNNTSTANGNNPKPVPPGVYKPKGPPYLYTISCAIAPDEPNYGGEYAGWDKSGRKSMLTSTQPFIVGFDANGRNEYFDQNHTIKYIDLLRSGVSVWNDARWRYRLSNINSDKIPDYLFLLDETGSQSQHDMDYTLVYDPDWNGIMNSSGEINTFWYTKEKLVNQKMPDLKNQLRVGNQPDVEDIAKRIYDHEFGHSAFGLEDLYGSPKLYPQPNIDNRSKVMYGVVDFWNIQGINRYDYSTYLNDKDIEGACRLGAAWNTSTNSTTAFVSTGSIKTISSTLRGISEEELYQDTSMITRGKIKGVSDSTLFSGYSEVIMSVNRYYKDLSGEYQKEIKYLQKGTANLQYTENMIRLRGMSVFFS